MNRIDVVDCAERRQFCFHKGVVDAVRKPDCIEATFFGFSLENTKFFQVFCAFESSACKFVRYCEREKAQHAELVLRKSFAEKSGVVVIHEKREVVCKPKTSESVQNIRCKNRCRKRKLFAFRFVVSKKGAVYCYLHVFYSFSGRILFIAEKRSRLSVSNMLSLQPAFFPASMSRPESPIM